MDVFVDTTNNSSFFDWSFLDTIDDTAIVQYTETLFKFRVVVFWNEYIDVKMVELANEKEILDYVNSFFQEPTMVTQMILPNPKYYTNGKSDSDETICSHFRLIAENYHSKSSTNYKLESFFIQSGIRGVSSRCTKAMIIGMAGSMDATYVSVPSQFWCVSLPVVETTIPEKDTVELCGIPGMRLPALYIPTELEWSILKYCQHPTATIMKDEIDRINRYWSDHFEWMFICYSLV
jgi:hypothetical protein